MSTAAAEQIEQPAEQPQVPQGRMNTIIEAGNTEFQREGPSPDAARYLWIALAPIFIGHRNHGASFMGDFPGEILPAKTPIRITSKKAYAPFELKAIAIETTESAFSPSLPEVDRHPNSYVSSNSAEALAKFIANEYVDFGIAQFEDLIDEDSADVANLFSLIFKDRYFDELEKGGKLSRVVEGITFEGPFLDQIRGYFETETTKIINRVGVTKEARELTQKAVASIVAAVSKALDFANGKLNDTEKLIRAKQANQPGKGWYDLPDHRFPNATPPLDLVCLAQTGRSPMDLKQLDASREMAETLGDSVVTGIKEAFAGGKLNDDEKISMKDVKKLLADQAAELRKELGPAPAPPVTGS